MTLATVCARCPLPIARSSAGWVHVPPDGDPPKGWEDHDVEPVTEVPQPLATYAAIGAQQLDMIEHLLAALVWEDLEPDQLTTALGLAERMRVLAARHLA